MNTTGTGKRVALVTGGTRGIGLGIAQRLASEGFDLALSGRRPETEVRGVLEELKQAGAEVFYWPADVASPADREGLLSQVRAVFGRLHVLVNNAGMAPRERRDLLEATEESFEEIIRVNLQGPYFLTQGAARWMIEQKKADPAKFRGCVINVGSVSATLASTQRGEYCISKAGVAMATALWAARLGEFDIPVYEIRPGITLTDMTAGVKEKYDRLIAEGLLVQGRWGTPQDVGKAAGLLARGELPYSTGQVLMVDGGLTLARL